MPEIVIPEDLKPQDGRFGSGPSKVRPEALTALAERATDYMGTSHRQAPVREMVRRIRDGLASLYSLPPGYEVVLGNGGATAFWDAMAFGLIENKSQHAVFGEFSSKAARAVAAAPHLEEPEIVESPPGEHPSPRASDVDLYAQTHNETSTGVIMPLGRVAEGGLVAVDATSAAGGVVVDPADFDVYYFAPQKCFSSDGGLWLALCSPAAVERIERISGSGRYIPASLDLKTALDNSRKDQTYNTPALATLFITAHQIEWMLDGGGLSWAAGRSRDSSDILYRWAEAGEVASPFVTDPAMRSPVVATIDLLEPVDAGAIARILRANGIVDVEPYRKLNRNQLRVGVYPAVDPGDVEQLTRCIDHIVEVSG